MGDSNRKYNLSEDGESFMAGILANYSSLFHFLCPTPNSVRRIKPSAFSGAYKVWSVENKEAPIRLLSPNKPGGMASHFEIKSLDHTANHYFAMASIIALGITGILEKKTLPNPGIGDPALLTEN